MIIAGRYHLRHPLADGLHLARDAATDQDVFARQVTLPPELDDAARRALVERLLAGAQEAARVRHPSIGTVLGAVPHGAPEGPAGPSPDPFRGVWILSAAVPGTALSQVLAAEGPLPPHRVAALGLDLAAALDAAHALGVAHRDVRPGNVWITPDGRGVLTGFGAGMPAHAGTASSVGTPGFTAPEGPDRPGPAADLFSLAATLYTAVEGVPPFPGTDPVAVLSAVLVGEPRRPERAGDLAPVLLARLAKDPAQRPPGLAEDLEPLAHPPRAAGRRVAVPPLRTAVVAAGLAVLTASLAVITTYTLAGDRTAVAANRAATSPATSPGTSPGATGSAAPTAADRFTTVPRACDLLTYPQADQVIPHSQRRTTDAQTPRGALAVVPRTECDISPAGFGDGLTVQVVAALFGPGPFGGGTETARQFVLGTEEETRDRAGHDTDLPAASVQRLTGSGDQAFAYDQTIMGNESTVVLSVGNVVVTVRCRRSSSDSTAVALVRPCATRSGQWVAAHLAAGPGGAR